ncbi:hypothetical protein LA03_09975 [Burkholderia gladioli]|nr:hypothetical protein LA03_09975 [Burkholderia gladioli]
MGSSLQEKMSLRHGAGASIRFSHLARHVLHVGFARIRDMPRRPCTPRRAIERGQAGGSDASQADDGRV